MRLSLPSTNIIIQSLFLLTRVNKLSYVVGFNAILSTSSRTFGKRSLESGNIFSIIGRRMTATTSETETVTKSKSSDVLSTLREKLEALNLDAYLIPSDDPHLSEYVAEAYARRAFISNFDGSAGTALVLRDSAYLWTDSRYFNQANSQLDFDHWVLMKDRLKDTPTITKFLTDKAKEKYDGSKESFKVGIDPFVHSGDFVKELSESLDGLVEDVEEDAEIGKVVSTESNLVDDIWGDAQPAIPATPFRVHPIEYAGQSVADKVKEVQEKMKEEKAGLCVFSALDDIAYLLNVRSKDISCNPVGISYATIHADDGVMLYCNGDKLSDPEVVKHFEEAKVQIAPYNQISEDITKFASSSKSKLWIDTKRTNYALTSLVPKKRIVDKINPIVYMKSIKNEKETEGMRHAHLVDGVAMANFISWLEEELQQRTVDELEIDVKLDACRAAQEGFIEPSFPTIAGVGPNGAIIHYRAHDDDIMKKLDLTQPILIDSGGQYVYGTTDVTRTWFFGSDISTEFRTMYTSVLKCNILLDTTIFPENTPGFVVDAFARRALWANKRDYGHGTGHGVGAALNVHEGPMGISPRFANMEVLKSGMILSNEPGYYKDGAYGIRIENLMEIVPLEKDESDDKSFLKFQKLTMIPIQTDILMKEMLTVEEMDWLDAYHAEVWEKVGERLEDGSKAKIWLERMCQKMDRS